MAVHHLLAHALRPSSIDGYQRHVRQFLEWAAKHRTGLDPFLRADTARDAYVRDVILPYIAWHVVYKGNTAGTVAGHLSALAHAHRSCGLPHPCGRPYHPRVALALQASKNFNPCAQERPPVGIEHLTHVHAWLHTKYQNDEPTRDLVWCAVVAAVFFMLRISEYACDVPIFDFDGSAVSYALRHRGVRFKTGGRLVSPSLYADMVGIYIPGSKTDGSFHGCWRWMSRGVGVICPVVCFARVLLRHPAPPGALQTDKGIHAEPLLFRHGLWPGGGGVTRKVVTAALQAGALRAGYSNWKLFVPHCCRIGGASLMNAAGFSTEQIRILGRWLSDAFRQYVRGMEDTVAHDPLGVLSNVFSAVIIPSADLPAPE
jgi:hypothetical protein